MGIILLWQRKEARQRLRPVVFILLFVLTFLITVFLSLSFFDSSTPLDNRILSPVYSASLILAGVMIGAFLAKKSFLRARNLTLLVCFLILFALQLPTGIDWTQTRRTEGLGYTSPLWTQSDLLHKLRIMSAGIPIYTNAEQPIYLQTGLYAIRIPRKYDPFTFLENRAFKSDLQQMGEKIKNQNGILVIFDTIPQRPYLPTTEEILQFLPLTPSVQAKDGTIYTWKDGS